MNSDKVYAEKQKMINDFEFNDKVADVFDDMLNRSVPFYSEIQRLAVSLGEKFYKDKTNIYDLGCSTGTTIEMFAKVLNNEDAAFTGYDTSLSMIEKAKEKLTKAGIIQRCSLINMDINQAEFSNSSVVFMLFTLQFVGPLLRDSLIKKIYDSMVDGGCLIIAEKVLGNETTINRVFIDLYYDFKRIKGYSDLEISQKREALENVLIPYRVDENLSLLKRNGFELVDIFFKWYNFTGFVAIKHPSEKRC